MDQMSETCNICNKPNDQMLMLSCVHDPCINCAASAYAEHIHIKGQSRELYVCEICGEETLLDNSTVAQLTALANSVIKLPSKATTSKSTPQTSMPARRKQTQHPNYPSSSLQPSAHPKKITYYCKQHSEQQITYYCFQCWANICPECVIHGSHKDHNVKLIKKAISQVRGEYLAVVAQVGESQNAMGKMKEGFLRLIKETNDRHARERNAVTREFDIIRAALAGKEKELLRGLQEINRQNIAALTQFLQVLSAGSEQGNKIKRSVEAITRKDEVLILEDYHKIGDLQQAVAQLNRSADAITGQSSHLNVEFMQQECSLLAEGVGKLEVTVKREELAVRKGREGGKE